MTEATGGTTGAAQTGGATGTSTEAGAGAAGAAGAGAAGAAGAQGAATSWLDSLTDVKLKGERSLAKFDTVEKLASAYIHAEKRLPAKPEQLLILPTDPADEAGMGEIYNKLGRPAEATGYKVEMGTNADAADKAFVDGFLPVAHKAGLTQAQLGSAIGYLNEVTAKAAADAELADTAATTATQDALKKEWGAKHPIYVAEIGKLLFETGGQGLVDELNAKGLGNSIGLSKLLALVVDGRAEPEVPGGAGGTPKVENGAMTPAQAKSARLELEQHPAFREKMHAQHAEVMSKRRNLLAMENPTPA